MNKKNHIKYTIISETNIYGHAPRPKRWTMSPFANIYIFLFVYQMKSIKSTYNSASHSLNSKQTECRVWDLWQWILFG